MPGEFAEAMTHDRPAVLICRLSSSQVKRCFDYNPKFIYYYQEPEARKVKFCIGTTKNQQILLQCVLSTTPKTFVFVQSLIIMGANSGGEIENWRQEICKCFWSQIQVMNIKKSNSAVTAMAKLQTGGDLKLLLAGQPMKMSE